MGLDTSSHHEATIKLLSDFIVEIPLKSYTKYLIRRVIHRYRFECYHCVIATILNNIYKQDEI